MNRATLIKNIQNRGQEPWDVIIIGGGATGLGIALDASTRGYRTLLLEQSDFSKSTSSKSTKLVHGGVRYLAKGDILLVTEALHERGIFLRNAPHLTSNQEFIIPVYSIMDVLVYYFGLKFYDLLSGRLSMGKSYYIGKAEALSRLPLLKPDGLKGGIVYHDGQFDDARMAVTLARACVESGGTTLNYIRVESLLKNEKNMIEGVFARDILSGDEYRIKGGLVINATGVFADEIHRMDDPHSKQSIRPSQGVHIVLENSFLKSNSAIMIPKTEDGRVLFAIPWYGKVVVGTTDTPIEAINIEPKALDEEIDFILKTASGYLIHPPERKDILCIFAGLRPLAADPANPSATREVSRRHKITLSSSGLLSIIGGKWTSYRRMAEETLDKGIKAGILNRARCKTKEFSFFKQAGPLKSERLKIYGAGSNEIEKMIADDPRLGEPLKPEFQYTPAEIIWICRNEMPQTVEDILARRTRALFLNAKASMEMAPEVARLMGEELGLDNEWQKKQIEEYRNLITNYL
jgi:glycerol-3-phosphate dehydrogenase